jgi:hypothetical protein
MAAAIAGASPQVEGAALTLADGRTASVTFLRDGIGGSLAIDGKEITLGAGVDSLPE